MLADAPPWRKLCRRAKGPLSLRHSANRTVWNKARQAHLFVVFVWMFFEIVLRGQKAPNQTDATAIQEIVQQYMDARNHQNSNALRALFTSDADQLVSTGEWRKGVDALVQGGITSSQKEAGKSVITLEAIRLLASDVALVDGRYQTTSAPDGVIRKMWTTLLMKRTDHGWRIAAIRNMLPVANSSVAVHH